MAEEKNSNNSRSITLSGDIEDDSAGKIIERIIDINDEDETVRGTLRDGTYKERPIKIIINSYGGEAHSALALVGVMETSVTPIHTLVFGKAMSAGLIVAVAGHVRFAHHLATYMYHEVADWNIGKLESQKRKLEENEKLMEMLDQYLLNRTKIDPDKLEKESLTDWYFSADEALKLGVCDYLIKADYSKTKEKPVKEKKRKKNENPS